MLRVEVLHKFPISVIYRVSVNWLKGDCNKIMFYLPLCIVLHHKKLDQFILNHRAHIFYQHFQRQIKSSYVPCPLPISAFCIFRIVWESIVIKISLKNFLLLLF
jgi:hypothetical protein